MNQLENLLSQLKDKKTRQDAKDNLDAIFLVCKKLKAADVKDFSIAKIARFGKEFGVPREQSIRNNKDYVTLIKAFSDEIKGADQKRKRRESRDAWIDEIENPRVRILVRQISNDLARAKMQIAEMKPLDNEITLRDLRTSFGEMLDQERRALQYLVSEDFLSDHDLLRGKRGDVSFSDGKELLKVGTLTAIEKMLK